MTRGRGRRVWGGDRTGIRISPVTPANDIADSDPQALFDHVVRAARTASAWPTCTWSRARPAARATTSPSTSRRCAQAFARAPGWPTTATTWTWPRRRCAAGRADLIAFGRPFIANPDLVERLRASAPLNALDKDTLYGGGAKGYTDYPALARKAA